MKTNVLAVLALLFSEVLGAAEAISPWSDSWQLLLNSEGCSLKREFSNERAQEANAIVGSDYEIFDRFDLWFYIPSESRETLANVEYVKGALHFSVLSQRYPAVSETQQRIESVRINGVELPRPNKSPTTSYRQFFLQGQEARDMLDLFESEALIAIDMELSGGDNESLGLRVGADQWFDTWSKLLFLCAEEMVSAD